MPLPENELIIYKTLRTIILNVTGVSECILAEQNAPAPQSDYASIFINKSVENHNRPYLDYTFNNQDLTLSNAVIKDLVMTVQVDFYREHANQKARLLKDCQYMPSVSNLLNSSKIGII